MHCVGHGISDFLTGSPLKLEKSDKKKEKKHGKFHLPSPLKSKSKESPKSDKKSRDATDSGAEVIQTRDEDPVLANKRVRGSVSQTQGDF